MVLFHRHKDVALLSGYADSSSRSNDTVTYVEYLTILKRAVTSSAECSASGHRVAGTLSYAYSSGWYDYDEISLDFCSNPITRQMAAKFTALAFDILKTETGDDVYWRYMQ